MTSADARSWRTLLPRVDLELRGAIYRTAHTYPTHGPPGAQEMRHLDAFRRFWEAVQRTYFASRPAANDLTGRIDQAEIR